MKRFVTYLFIAILIITAGLSSAVFAAEPEVTWKWAHYQPVDSLVDKLTNEMKKEIEEKSGGSIKITIFPANQLGDWMEVSEQIMRGVVHIGTLPVSPSYDPRLQVRVLPYSVMNWEEAENAYLGKNPYIFNIMADAMDDVGLKALGVVAAGFGGAGFASVPTFDVLDPESDKQGYKMRFPPGNQAWQGLVLSLGYIPTPVPWGELYIAQQTKLVDCQVGGQPYNSWTSFRDVTKLWVQYNTHFQNDFIYMNKEAWEKLSPRLKEIVQVVASKYAAKSFSMAMEEDQKYRDMMEGQGIKIIMPTDDQLKIIADKVRLNVWPDMDKVIGKEIMDIMRKNSGVN